MVGDVLMFFLDLLDQPFGMPLWVHSASKYRRGGHYCHFESS